MPRKRRGTQKPPLLFVEQSLGGARVQAEPEVRAAVRPKSFLLTAAAAAAAAHPGNTSWVSPQFEASHLTALPARRGRRRKGNATTDLTTSVLDRSSQLSRKPCLKTSVVCRFPALSFERSPTQPANHDRGQPKQTRGRVSVSTSRQQQQPPQHQQLLLLPSGRRGTSLPAQQTPKRRPLGTPPDESTSSSVGSQRPPSSPLPSRRSPPLRPRAEVNASPPRAARSPVDGGDGSCLVSSPPDVGVDTPEQLPPRRGPSPQPETLVADTPEEDYGLR
ncbi:hypothetical protein CRUP_015974, partial [Coryphaenoides rupestris]